MKLSYEELCMMRVALAQRADALNRLASETLERSDRSTEENREIARTREIYRRGAREVAALMHKVHAEIVSMVGGDL